jgi:hypothetical protein
MGQKYSWKSRAIINDKALVLTGVAKFGLVGCTESPAYDR